MRAWANGKGISHTWQHLLQTMLYHCNTAARPSLGMMIGYIAYKFMDYVFPAYACPKLYVINMIKND